MAERWPKDMYPLLREFIRGWCGNYPMYFPEPDEEPEITDMELEQAEGQLTGLCAMQSDPAGAARFMAEVQPTYRMTVFDRSKEEHVPLRAYEVQEHYS